MILKTTSASSFPLGNDIGESCLSGLTWTSARPIPQGFIRAPFLKDFSGTEVGQCFGPFLNSVIYEEFSNPLQIGAANYHDISNIGVRRNLLCFNWLPMLWLSVGSPTRRVVRSLPVITNG